MGRLAGPWPVSSRLLVAGLLFLALGALLLGEVRAQGQATRIDDEARHIARDIQCPVCQGLSVADSPSELALQMREVIREQLQAGATREQVLTYFVDRYGESILLDPPRSGFGVVIWLAPPVVVLAVGALLLGRARRRQQEPPAVAAEAGDLDPYYDEVDQAFSRLKDQRLR